jgi:hypothetical protein
MSTARLTKLVLVERARRIAMLLGFGSLFLVAGIATRILAGGGDHVELDKLFMLGGYQVISSLMLLAWLLGRFPLIATLVLLSGVFSADRVSGYARLYGVRPVSLVSIYGFRTLALLAVAFVISAVVLPGTDILMMGRWNGPATLVVAGCYVMVYGGVVALLSVFFRNEGWIALMLAITAMVWDALRRGNVLAEAPPGVKQVVSFLLPPQGPLFRIETAFANTQPIPWTDVAYVCGYGFVLLLGAAVFIADREI